MNSFSPHSQAKNSNKLSFETPIRINIKILFDTFLKPPPSTKTPASLKLTDQKKKNFDLVN